MLQFGLGLAMSGHFGVDISQFRDDLVALLRKRGDSALILHLLLCGKGAEPGLEVGIEVVKLFDLGIEGDLDLSGLLFEVPRDGVPLLEFSQQLQFALKLGLHLSKLVLFLLVFRVRLELFLGGGNVLLGSLEDRFELIERTWLVGLLVGCLGGDRRG